MNLADDLYRRATEAPDRVAFVFEDGRSWTYRELDDYATRAAAKLREHGVTRGDRVGVVLPNSPQLVATLFGAWKLGAVPVAISSLYNAAELAKTVAQTEPDAFVVHEDNRAALAAAPTAVPALVVGPTVDPFDGRGQVPLEPEDMSDDDEAVILFTGGTTGLPKPVAMTHGGALGAVAKLAEVSKGRPGPYELAPAEVPPNLLVLPLFHSGGQQAMLFSFHVGRSLLLMERFRVARLADLVPKYGIDNLFLMPTMLYDIVHHRESVDLASVRSVLIAGQALSPELRRQFEERFNIPIIVNYGSTEMGHVAGWTRSDMKEGRWKPGAAGRVYAGVDVEIRDDAGTALPPDQVGEVCVKADITTGYVGDAEATGALIRDGWVHSGDMGYFDGDGVLFLIGRKRDMIKTGGFQVWPAEIEEAMREHPLVADLAVVGVPDDRLGEIPKAFVVASAGDRADDALAAELVALTRDRLAHFKAVRAVQFLDELPRTEAGKISRGDLASGGERWETRS